MMSYRLTAASSVAIVRKFSVANPSFRPTPSTTRKLDRRISTAKSLTYRARPTATFKDFAERWQLTVLRQHKPSSQGSEKY